MVADSIQHRDLLSSTHCSHFHDDKYNIVLHIGMEFGGRKRTLGREK